MKYRIHIQLGDYSDFIDIEGDTIDEIRDKAKQWEESRGIDSDKAHLWSEELEA